MNTLKIAGKLTAVAFAALLAVGCSTTETTTGGGKTPAELQAEQAERERQVAIAKEEEMKREKARAMAQLEEERRNIETVYYFEFDRSELTRATQAALTEAAAFLKKTNQAVIIEGHADERGTREYNMALSERRAKAVAAFLEGAGVRSRMEIVPKGEEEPATLGSNSDAWAKNRRAVLMFK